MLRRRVVHKLISERWWVVLTLLVPETNSIINRAFHLFESFAWLANIWFMMSSHWEMQICRVSRVREFVRWARSDLDDTCYRWSRWCNTSNSLSLEVASRIQLILAHHDHPNAIDDSPAIWRENLQLQLLDHHREHSFHDWPRTKWSCLGWWKRTSTVRSRRSRSLILSHTQAREMKLKR